MGREPSVATGDTRPKAVGRRLHYAANPVVVLNESPWFAFRLSPFALRLSGFMIVR